MAIINVGNASLPAGYYKFKTKAITGRPESPVSESPVFTASTVNTNSYTLSQPSSTSAGVYINDGVDDILIKTLWSGKKEQAGVYSISNLWNGRDDNGNLLPSNGNYKLKVLSNTFTDVWGVVGQTSPQTGPSRWNGHHSISAMVFVGTKGYVQSHYQEGSASRVRFDISNPHAKELFVLPLESGSMSLGVQLATDGTYVYWAEQGVPDNLDASGTDWNNWVIATRVSDNEEHIFPNGASYRPNANRLYQSVISKQKALITGIAVNSNFIFVARAENNAIQVYNKNGALVNTVSITSPWRMAAEGNSSLWVINGTNTVKKYNINGDGSLTATAITLAGLSLPYAIQVNPSGTAVAVVDAGTSQQVKFFSTSTGASTFTLGQVGGYSTNATVTNDKFDFYRREFGYIGFQPDGSYWVGDYGNQRNQHYSSSNVFINNISYIEYMRSAWTDPNNPTRVFGQFLEFTRDYSKPISPTNGSWLLTKNWSGGLLPKVQYLVLDNNSEGPEYDYAKWVTTFPNGQTFALFRNTIVVNGSKQGRTEVVELIGTGTSRPTGIFLQDGNYQFASDGSLVRVEVTHPINSANQSTVRGNSFRKRPLTGYSNGNPVWGAEIQLEYIEGLMLQDPISVDFAPPQAKPLANGVYVTYSEDANNTPYSLGGVKNGKWIFKTAPKTHLRYQGDYPKDGYFEIGHGVQNSHIGGQVKIIDNLIFQGHHGEGYMFGGQTNIYNIFHQNGLFVSQCGTYGMGKEISGKPKMAGNALTMSVTKVGNDYYIHHPDESVNGGVHEFKISGSINEFLFSVPFPSDYVEPYVPYVELFKNLPLTGILSTGGNLTLSSPSSTDFTPNTAWTVQAGKYSYKAPTDVSAKFNKKGLNINEYVKVDLGSMDSSYQWFLEGEIVMDTLVVGNKNIAMITVRDINNKIIAKFDFYVPVYSLESFRIRGNDVNIHYNNLNDYGELIQGIGRKLQYFRVGLNNAGTISFNYANYPTLNVAAYDSTANKLLPKYLSMEFSSGDNSQGSQGIALKGIKFTPNI